jgi:hypothetical protein
MRTLIVEPRKQNHEQEEHCEKRKNTIARRS